MALVVVTIEGYNSFTKGTLQRSLLEIRANVFVGKIDRKRFGELSKFLETQASQRSSALVVYQNEKLPGGFEFLGFGENRRNIVLSDGLVLAKYSRHFSGRN